MLLHAHQPPPKRAICSAHCPTEAAAAQLRRTHIDNCPLAKGILRARAFPWRDGAAVGRPDGHWGGPKLDVAAGTPPQSHHAPSQIFAAVIFDAAWEQEAANRARGLLGGQGAHSACLRLGAPSHSCVCRHSTQPQLVSADTAPHSTQPSLASADTAPSQIWRLQTQRSERTQPHPQS